MNYLDRSVYKSEEGLLYRYDNLTESFVSLFGGSSITYGMLNSGGGKMELTEPSEIASFIRENAELHGLDDDDLAQLEKVIAGKVVTRAHYRPFGSENRINRDLSFAISAMAAATSSPNKAQCLRTACFTLQTIGIFVKLEPSK